MELYIVLPVQSSDHGKRYAFLRGRELQEFPNCRVRPSGCAMKRMNGHVKHVEQVRRPAPRAARSADIALRDVIPSIRATGATRPTAWRPLLTAANSFDEACNSWSAGMNAGFRAGAAQPSSRNSTRGDGRQTALNSISNCHSPFFFLRRDHQWSPVEFKSVGPGALSLVRKERTKLHRAFSDKSFVGPMCKETYYVPSHEVGNQEPSGTAARQRLCERQVIRIQRRIGFHFP